MDGWVLVPTGYSRLPHLRRTFRVRPSQSGRREGRDRPLQKFSSQGFRIVMVLAVVVSSGHLIGLAQRW
jgi:hypothetical protein